MSPLLEVNNLSVYFGGTEPKNDKAAVRNASFILERGEILGIVGESGSGKSVMSLSIPGLLPYPKAYHDRASSVKFQGRECLGAPEKELRKIRGGKIGFIFQEPMSSLNPLHRIGDQIAENLLVHQKITPQKAKKCVVELLKRVGISDPQTRYNAYPFELSGGQRQRVMIAMAIANKPDILIADEPTTALDVTVQEQIINLLIELKKEYGMSIIFISHDLLLVHRIADRILVVKQGEIVESGTSEQIFNRPLHDYTKTLVGAVLKRPEVQKKDQDIVLSAKNINVEFVLQKNFWGRPLRSLKAVDNVSLALYKGRTLGLVGESGSGKTTLGHCLAGLCRYRGDVTLSETGLTAKQFHQKVQIVFQDPYNSLNPRLTVRQIVGEGLKIHFPELTEACQIQKVINMLIEVGLSEQDLNKYPHEFSGGQRQRIAIARALILNPEVVILDEPTSALDVTIQIQIIELLRKIQQKYGVSYLFISHDMRAVRSLADDIAVMKDGKIVELATADKIFAHPQTEYTQHLINASLIK